MTVAFLVHFSGSILMGANSLHMHQTLHLQNTRLFVWARYCSQKHRLCIKAFPNHWNRMAVSACRNRNHHTRHKATTEKQWWNKLLLMVTTILSLFLELLCTSLSKSDEFQMIFEWHSFLHSSWRQMMCSGF